MTSRRPPHSQRKRSRSPRWPRALSARLRPGPGGQGRLQQEQSADETHRHVTRLPGQVGAGMCNCVAQEGCVLRRGPYPAGHHDAIPVVSTNSAAELSPFAG